MTDKYGVLSQFISPTGLIRRVNVYLLSSLPTALVFSLHLNPRLPESLQDLGVIIIFGDLAVLCSDGDLSRLEIVLQKVDYSMTKPKVLIEDWLPVALLGARTLRRPLA